MNQVLGRTTKYIYHKGWFTIVALGLEGENLFYGTITQWDEEMSYKDHRWGCLWAGQWIINKTKVSI